MQKFLQRFAGQVNGVLSGWDRLSIRGSIRWIASLSGLRNYLSCHDIRLKNFAGWARGLTKQIRSASEELAHSLGIRSLYLESCAVDKDGLARQIAQQDNIQTGPICMLSVVEPAYSQTVVGSRQTKKLELVMRKRKCVWIYFYFNDENLGFGHLRIQSWVPFTIKGCLNGRHWLERSLMHEKIGYVKHENCFRWLADPKRAQQLFDEQLASDWPKLLGELLERYFPVMGKLLGENQHTGYYWSIDESELATDIMFHNTATLDRLFPMLARHGLCVTDSASVMRFLGRIKPEAALPSRTRGDVRSDRKRRYEGVCIKHRNGANSVKLYNKAGNVLRAETTINDTRAFKVFRNDIGAEEGKGSWLRMRKGVADTHRRAALSLASNARYLDALAACPTNATVLEAIEGICKRTQRSGRSVRALNPCSPHDFHLLRFLGQGQWAINGLRNRDLASWIEPKMEQLSDEQKKKLSSRVSRLLGILRCHGLIRKVPKSHRYQITQKGHELAVLIASVSSVQAEQLIQLAA